MTPPSEEDIVGALSTVPLFAAASHRGLAGIAARTELQSYPEGQYIFQRGEPSRHVFVVARGSISVLDPWDPSATSPSTLEPGDVFGELGVLAGRARTASAMATRPSEAWRIEGEAFVGLFGTEPGVSIEVISLLARYVMDSSGVAEDLLLLDLKGRVAKRLIQLQDARGGDSQVAIDIAELAALSGGTRIGVERILDELARAGALSHGPDAVVIIDRSALEPLFT